MEFFKIINIHTTKDQIQKHINFDTLDNLCTSIFVMNFKNNTANIGGGLRFSLLECPNALTFTITTGYQPKPNQIVLHLTVNRLELKPIFIEEIEEFIDDWKSGIEKYFKL